MFELENMRRLAMASAIAAALVSIAATAQAGPEDSSDERRLQATTLFDQGQRLADSDPKGALSAYRASYEIRNDWRVLFNIGKMCKAINDNACAIKSWEQYLRDGGSDVPAARRKTVEADLKGMGVKVHHHGATIVIKSSITGAYVKVDGVVVGRTPLEKPVSVAAGTHKVVLVADGNVLEKSVHVAANASETVELDARKEDAPAPAVAAPPPPPTTEAEPPPPAPIPAPPPAEHAHAPPRVESRHTPIAPWVITGTLAAGTAVTSIFLVGANSDYNKIRDEYPITKDALDASHDRAKMWLITTGILGGATLISLGVASYFTWFRGSPAPSNKSVGKVGFAIGPTGFAITGTMQ